MYHHAGEYALDGSRVAGAEFSPEPSLSRSVSGGGLGEYVGPHHGVSVVSADIVSVDGAAVSVVSADIVAVENAYAHPQAVAGVSVGAADGGALSPGGEGAGAGAADGADEPATASACLLYTSPSPRD